MGELADFVTGGGSPQSQPQQPQQRLSDLVTGTPPAKAPMPTGPPKGTWEQPKGVRPSPLREVTDAMSSLPYAAYAAAASLPQWSKPGEKIQYQKFRPELLRQMWKDYNDPKMTSAQFNEKWDPYTPGGAKTYGQDIVGKNPLKAMAGETVLQWYNPMYRYGGRALEIGGTLLGQGFRAAREASPVFHEAMQAYEDVGRDMARPFQAAAQKAGTVGARMTQAAASAVEPLTSFFDRYAAAGLRKAGGEQYVHAARHFQSAVERQVAQAHQHIHDQFTYKQPILKTNLKTTEGLTQAQKIEVQKLSYYEDEQAYKAGTRIATRDPNVPEPKHGPTLEQRADALRADIIDRGQRAVKAGVATQEQLSSKVHNPYNYWPMRKFGDQPVYKDARLEAAAAAGDDHAVVPYVTQKGATGAQVGGNVFKSGRLRKGPKSLHPITNPEVEERLHPDYDPAHQVIQHARDLEGKIANEEQRKILERLQPEQPRELQFPFGSSTVPAKARMQMAYGLTSGQQLQHGVQGVAMPRFFGWGETGQAELEKYIQFVARRLAQEQARHDPDVLALAQEHNIDPERLVTRTLRQANRNDPIVLQLAKAHADFLGIDPSVLTMSDVRRLAADYDVDLSHLPAELRARPEAAAHARLRAAVQSANRAARGHSTILKIATGAINRTGKRAEAAFGDLMDIEGERREALEQAKPVITKRTSEDAAAAAREEIRKREAALEPGKYGRAKGKEAEARYAAKQTAASMMKVQARATGYTQREAEALAAEQARFQQELAETETTKAYRAAAKRHYRAIHSRIAQGIRDEAEHAPLGYTKESELELGSPSQRAMVLDDSFARFFTPHKTTVNEVENARKFWEWMQIGNRMSKLSVVLLPWVHGVNNLGMHYLAEGGDIKVFMDIVEGKKEFAPGLVARAEKHGATTAGGPNAFGIGAHGVHATTATSEKAARVAEKMGPFGVLARKPIEGAMHAANAQNAMNEWLFNEVEHKLAIDMFDRFTKAGMSDAEAGLRVRNALGRYDNLSPQELARSLNKVFYFYPWMKTVIPFWVKKGIIDPKWWAAPVRAIQVNNEQQGYDDPSKPFTATFGHLPGGEWRRVTAPIPQRITEPLSSAARVPFDIFGGDKAGMAEDIKSAATIPLYHLNPFWSSVAQLAEVGAQGKRASPYNLIYDPGQLAGKVISPVQKAIAMKADPLGGFLTTIAGASEYGVKTAAQAVAQKQKLQAVYNQFNGPIRTAVESGPGGEALAQKLREKRAKMLQAIRDNADPKVMQAIMKLKL